MIQIYNIVGGQEHISFANVGQERTETKSKHEPSIASGMSDHQELEEKGTEDEIKSGD